MVPSPLNARRKPSSPPTRAVASDRSTTLSKTAADDLVVNSPAPGPGKTPLQSALSLCSWKANRCPRCPSVPSVAKTTAPPAVTVGEADTEPTGTGRMLQGGVRHGGRQPALVVQIGQRFVGVEDGDPG